MEFGLVKGRSGILVAEEGCCGSPANSLLIMSPLKELMDGSASL